MKRFLLFAVAVLAFVGCNEMFEDEGNSSLALSELPTLTAGFEDTDTRTYVESNKYLRWHEGDLISAFVGDTKNVKYIFDGKTGDTSGEFKPANDENVGSDNIFDNIYAVYPYYVSTAISNDGVIDYFMPDIQTYDADTFGRGANTAVAITESKDDTSLMFKNVGGYLKIKLYGEGSVKSIKVNGNNGEKIVGNSSITTTYDGLPTIAMADDATDAIILDCGEGVELSADAENPTEFWVVVPPTTFNKGITITVTDIDGGIFEKTTSNEVVIERNIIQPMTAVEAEFEAVAQPTTTEIWYTSTDGEIVTPTNADAFGTTILTNTYKNGKGVITFAGEVTAIGAEAFHKLDTLQSITLPDTVTEVAEGAISQCPNLEAIYSDLSTSNHKALIVNDVIVAFAPKGITKYNIPTGVKRIGAYTFAHCKELTKVVISDGVEVIGAWSFTYCSELTRATIASSVHTIEEGAFSYCGKLVFDGDKYRVDNGGGIVDDSDTLVGIVDIPTDGRVVIDDNVTGIGEGALKDSEEITELVIPESVTEIYAKAFFGCEKLKSVTCLAVEPPTAVFSDGIWAAFDGHAPNRKIYVPTESVAAYKSAPGWKDYADAIYPMDSYVPSEPVIGNNEIWYTSDDGQIIEPSRANVFGANVISNTYENDKGVITFDGEVTTIGEDTFVGCSRLTSITIPDSVTEIGYQAFSYCNSLTSITIPDSVTTIGGYAFYGCRSLTSVIIGDSVTTIGDSAFYYCSSLTSVTIPDSVTTIGDKAFGYCDSLTSVIIGDSVTTIGRSAFEGCSSLTSIAIPDSVTTIGHGAFADCDSLKEFNGEYATDNGRCLIKDNTIIAYAEASGTEYTIPDSVTTIGECAFLICESLTSITIPDSVTTIGDGAFVYCESLTSIYCEATTPPSIGYDVFYYNANSRKIYVPTESVNDYKTAEGWSDYADDIVTYDFDKGEVVPDTPMNNEIWYTSDDGQIIEPSRANVFGANVISNTYENDKGVITFDGDVITIGEDAFVGCSRLTSITIPNSVTTIGDNAFYGCYSLTSVTIPDSVTTIGDYAFCECYSLTSVTIPDSVTKIGNSAFYNCSSLTSVTIGDSVTTIGDEAFCECGNLTNITIPDSVTTIGDYAFFICASLTSVTIPDNVTTIGDYAFGKCHSLTSVTIGESATTIGDYAFFECHSLTDVTIPDSVTTIGECAFLVCESLTSITIPDSVTTIGDGVFHVCSSLTNVYCKATTPPSIGYGVFDDNAKSRKIYVPTESVNDYKAAEGWSDYADDIVAYDFDKGEVVPDTQMNNEIWYTSDDGQIIEPSRDNVFGANVISNTYENDKGVITFDGDVTTIGEEAFVGCSRLTSITIPDSVTTIGKYAFYGCISLPSVTIPDSVTTIGGNAFHNCKNLKNLHIKDLAGWCNVEISDEYANPLRYGGSLYVNDEVITHLVIPNDVTKINDYTFYGCHSFEYITIPDSVTIIGDYAFDYCKSLINVTFGKNVTTIGRSAFYWCTNLRSVTIPDSVTEIGRLSFAFCDRLSTMTIGKNVSKIGGEAFGHNYCLYEIYCKPTTPPELESALGISSLAYDFKIYVPSASVDAYRSAKNWSEFSSHIHDGDF